MKANAIVSIPPYNAKSESWIQFHKDLLSNFGKKQANSTWVKAWGIRGNKTANDSDLRGYLGKEGIIIDKSTWDSVIDEGGGIADTFSDMFSVGKYVGIGLAVIIVGGLAMIVYNIAKNPIEAAKVALSAKTGGLNNIK